ncbi:hypothetical protein C8Q74DRAFT_1220733 [Fomes fomentarius]|nr:hypothetical protein C8Q74DRAFT_1220733 [Fomes fomentarius]
MASENPWNFKEESIEPTLEANALVAPGHRRRLPKQPRHQLLISPYKPPKLEAELNPAGPYGVRSIDQSRGSGEFRIGLSRGAVCYCWTISYISSATDNLSIQASNDTSSDYSAPALAGSSAPQAILSPASSINLIVVRQRSVRYDNDDPSMKSSHTGSRSRRLTLTEKRKNPSWIGEKWFVRRGLTSYYTLTGDVSDNIRVANDDLSHWEERYTEALRELQSSDSCNAALLTAVLTIRRSQKSVEARMLSYEAMLQASQNEAEKAVNDLQTRVLALELENKVLKAKMESYKKEHAEVNGVLTSIQTWAAQADQSIEHLSDDSALSALRREFSFHLRFLHNLSKSTSPGSLVAELVRASEPSESHASEVLIPSNSVEAGLSDFSLQSSDDYSLVLRQSGTVRMRAPTWNRADHSADFVMLYTIVVLAQVISYGTSVPVPSSPAPTTRASMDNSEEEQSISVPGLLSTTVDVACQWLLIGCACDICGTRSQARQNHTWLDEHKVEREGRLFKRADTVKKHMLQDQLVAENVAASTILLAAASSSDPRPLESLPIRTPDVTQGDMDAAPSTGPLRRRKNAEPARSTGGDEQEKPLGADKHTCKTRLSVLSGIQSYLDAHRKLIPSNLVLDFSGSSIPPNTTFNDPVPEPPNSGAQNPLYHNIRDKILVQKKHLEELPPSATRIWITVVRL